MSNLKILQERLNPLGCGRFLEIRDRLLHELLLVLGAHAEAVVEFLQEFLHIERVVLEVALECLVAPAELRQQHHRLVQLTRVLFRCNVLEEWQTQPVTERGD
jgi:hypothetical protein